MDVRSALWRHVVASATAARFHAARRTAACPATPTTSQREGNWLTSYH
jgi:hypothetical protein